MKTYINYLNESMGPNSMTEEEQIKYVQEYWSNIKNIDDPSLKVQLSAVENNGNAIQHIKNPSENVQLAAIKRNTYAILNIQNPSEEVKRYVANHIYFNKLLKYNANTTHNFFIKIIQNIIKDYITKEMYYKAPKDYPWIPEIKEKFKDIDRFKRFNL